MPAAFEAVSTVVSPGGTNNLIFPKPGAGAAGTLAVVVLVVFNDTWDTPAGWIVLRDDTLVVVPAFMRVTVEYRVFNGLEGPSFTFSGVPIASNRAGAMLTFTGVNTGSPIDAHNIQTGTHATDIICPSILTTVANALILRYSGSAPGGVAGTVSPPAGFTERADAFSPTPMHVSVHTANTIQVGAGATGIANILKAGFTAGQSDIGGTIAVASLPSGHGGNAGGVPSKQVRKADFRRDYWEEIRR